MFPHKTIEITIQPTDETEYILSDPAYAAELAERIEEYNKKKEVITIKDDCQDYFNWFFINEGNFLKIDL